MDPVNDHRPAAAISSAPAAAAAGPSPPVSAPVSSSGRTADSLLSSAKSRLLVLDDEMTCLDLSLPFNFMCYGCTEFLEQPISHGGRGRPRKDTPGPPKPLHRCFQPWQKGKKPAKKINSYSDPLEWLNDQWRGPRADGSGIEPRFRLRTALGPGEVVVTITANEGDLRLKKVAKLTLSSQSAVATTTTLSAPAETMPRPMDSDSCTSFGAPNSLLVCEIDREDDAGTRTQDDPTTSEWARDDFLQPSLCMNFHGNMLASVSLAQQPPPPRQPAPCAIHQPTMIGPVPHPQPGQVSLLHDPFKASPHPRHPTGTPPYERSEKRREADGMRSRSEFVTAALRTASSSSSTEILMDPGALPTAFTAAVTAEHDQNQPRFSMVPESFVPQPTGKHRAPLPSPVSATNPQKGPDPFHCHHVGQGQINVSPYPVPAVAREDGRSGPGRNDPPALPPRVAPASAALRLNSAASTSLLKAPPTQRAASSTTGDARLRGLFSSNPPVMKMPHNLPIKKRFAPRPIDGIQRTESTPRDDSSACSAAAGAASTLPSFAPSQGMGTATVSHSSSCSSDNKQATASNETQVPWPNALKALIETPVSGENRTMAPPLLLECSLKPTPAVSPLGAPAECHPVPTASAAGTARAAKCAVEACGRTMPHGRTSTPSTACAGSSPSIAEASANVLGHLRARVVASTTGGPAMCMPSVSPANTPGPASPVLGAAINHRESTHSSARKENAAAASGWKVAATVPSALGLRARAEGPTFLNPTCPTVSDLAQSQARVVVHEKRLDAGGGAPAMHVIHVLPTHGTATAGDRGRPDASAGLKKQEIDNSERKSGCKTVVQEDPLTGTSVSAWSAASSGPYEINSRGTIQGIQSVPRSPTFHEAAPPRFGHPQRMLSYSIPLHPARMVQSGSCSIHNGQPLTPSCQQSREFDSGLQHLQSGSDFRHHDRSLCHKRQPQTETRAGPARTAVEMSPRTRGDLPRRTAAPSSYSPAKRVALMESYSSIPDGSCELRVQSRSQTPLLGAELAKPRSFMQVEEDHPGSKDGMSVAVAPVSICWLPFSPISRKRTHLSTPDDAFAPQAGGRVMHREEDNTPAPTALHKRDAPPAKSSFEGEMALGVSPSIESTSLSPKCIDPIHMPRSSGWKCEQECCVNSAALSPFRLPGNNRTRLFVPGELDNGPSSLISTQPDDTRNATAIGGQLSERHPFTSWNDKTWGDVWWDLCGTLFKWR